MKYFLLTVIVLLAFVIPQGYVSHDDQIGKVIDTTTGEPIKGAVIVQETINYDRVISMSTSDVCIHTATAMSDAVGSYTIPAWNQYRFTTGFGKERYRSFAYKAGYAMDSVSGNTFYMKPYNGTVLERALYLRPYLYACRSTIMSKSLLLLYRAMLDEAKSFTESEVFTTKRRRRAKTKEIEANYEKFIAKYISNEIRFIEEGHY